MTCWASTYCTLREFHLGNQTVVALVGTADRAATVGLVVALVDSVAHWLTQVHPI